MTDPPEAATPRGKGQAKSTEPNGAPLRLVVMGAATTGDEARLRRMYADHGAMLLAFTSRLCGGDRQRAEDVVQETLVRAWRHPEISDPGPDAERAWLITVARNITIDGFRASGSRPTEVGGAALEAVEGRAGDNEIDRALEEWAMAEALAKISPDHRAVLIETYFRGHSVAEAAAVLGIPQGTVKSRSFHALRALRRVLVEGGARV